MIVTIAAVHGEARSPELAGSSPSSTDSAEPGPSPVTHSNTILSQTNDADGFQPIETIDAQVVDPAGNPIPGAFVFVASTPEYYAPHDARVFAQVTSDAAGKVAIPWGTLPSYRIDRQLLHNDLGFTEQHLTLVVAAPGYVPVSTSPMLLQRQENKITLQPNAVPIHGRVVNLEGRPIAGVKVSVAKIVPSHGDVDAWLEKARNAPPGQGLTSDTANDVSIQAFPNEWFKGPPVFPAGLPLELLSTTSDQDGRFTLEGFPRDALVKLVLESREIAKGDTYVFTREMKAIPLPEFSASNYSQQCYGATFDYVAQPCQPIFGVVRDRDSGKPIAGATVVLDQVRLADSVNRFSMGRYLETKTNAAGEYILYGVAKRSPQSGLSHTLEVSPPEDSRYPRFPGIPVPLQDGMEPIQVDVSLKPGVLVTGKLLDAETGQPVQGLVGYYPLTSNPHLSDYPNYRRGQSSAVHDLYATAEDGSFSLPAIAGPGLLTGTGIEVDKYLPGAGADAAGWPHEERPRYSILLLEPTAVHALDLLEIEPDTKAIEHNVRLIPMQKQTFSVQGPNGESVEATGVAGTRPLFMYGIRYVPGAILGNATWTEGSEFDVFGLEAVERRRLLIRDPKNKWCAAEWVKHGEARTLTLAPMGTVRGRIVAAAGQPLANREVTIIIPPDEIVTPAPYSSWQKALLRQRLGSATTDSDGQFKLEGIYPGVRLELQLDRKTFREVDPVAAGAEASLGDIKFAAQ